MNECIVVQFNYFLSRLQTIFYNFHWKNTRKLYKVIFLLHRLDKEILGIRSVQRYFSRWKYKTFWTFLGSKVKASNFAMKIIRNGYSLPFENIPPPFYAQNNKSSLKEKRFVAESIKKLLDDRCIRAVEEPPRCINPLTVA